MKNLPLRQESLLLIIPAFLCLFGLLSIYLSSSLKGIEIYQDPFYFVRKQGLAIAFGFFVVFITQKVPLSWLGKITLPTLFLSLILLFMIFIPGAYSKVGGAARWLNLGGFRFQTSELAKIALVFFLAKNLSRKKADINKTASVLVPNLIIILVFSFLLLQQPDFGTAVLLMSVGFLMLFVFGISRKFILLAIGSGLAGGAFFIISTPYRLKRILSFLDPWSTKFSEGFQIIQSYLAFRNGGFAGVGLGASKQKLFFLPEAHTDFILAVIAEEWGLLGSLLICLSFLLLILIGFNLAKSLSNQYHKSLAFGISSLIAIQSLFNICVVMGLLPTKGISLPFVSSGLSSLLVFIFLAGVLYKLSTSENNRAHREPTTN